MDPKALRNAYGRFMTGVVVAITEAADGRRVGFTANSFASVSLDPPLVSICPGQFLSSYEEFKACSRFTVSVLAADQQDVAEVFAGYKGDRFAKVDWSPGAQTGLPVIDGAAASFECDRHQVVTAGDHIILIGQVLGFKDAGKPGLGYNAGNFFTLNSV